MTVDFLNVLITVFALVVLAVPGFLLKKFKMLPENATKALTTVLLFASQPCLTFMSFQKTAYHSEVLVNMLILAGLVFLVHAVMIALILIVLGRKGNNDKKVNVVKFASIFGNCGFLGIPFLQSLFPGNNDVIVYAGVFVAVFNFLSWTVGIFLITGDKKFISIKKAFLNPPFIALLISLPLFIILQKPLSSVGASGSFINIFLTKFSNSLDLLGNSVTPLSMTILGIRLAEMKLKQLFTNFWVYFSTCFKLIVMPFVAFVILLIFSSIAMEIKVTLLFICSMPSATQTLLFSEQYGGEPYTASTAVLLSTILAIISIPLISLLFVLL